jgi:hypothetical protein
MKDWKRHIGPIASVLAFLAAYGFFQFAYPYHLMRREQMTLFLFDGDYIRQTYRGSGWLARFVCDFLDQFFHLPVVGPLVVALLLTAIGVVTYRIVRRFLGKWPSFAVAALVFAWSFLRETENLYSTRYTLVVLGYLALLLLALQPRKGWLKVASLAVLAGFGVWSLGSPVQQYYGKPWGYPILSYDQVIGLDTEVARENWDKVIKLSEKDLYMTEASYCYNLAHAMKGNLGKALFNHSQKQASSLFIQISNEKSAFSDCLGGEVWFHLGDMTIAEQSAIIALQASPKHTGARYIKRLAQTSLISGEKASAQKYLNLLSKTMFYGKWARRMMTGNQEGTVAKRLESYRSRLAHTDFVHRSNLPRSVLLGLLEADSSNALAWQYLLCYDLMRLDLEHFVEDYPEGIPAKSVYQEALLIWLSLQDVLDEPHLARYGIESSAVDRMGRFFRNPSAFRDSYWYYYLNAMEEDKR